MHNLKSQIQLGNELNFGGSQSFIGGTNTDSELIHKIIKVERGLADLRDNLTLDLAKLLLNNWMMVSKETGPYPYRVCAYLASILTNDQGYHNLRHMIATHFEQITDMSKNLVVALEGKLFIPTPIFFVYEIANIDSEISVDTIQNAISVLKIISIHVNYYNYNPDMLAAAAIFSKATSTTSLVIDGKYYKYYRENLEYIIHDIELMFYDVMTYISDEINFENKARKLQVPKTIPQPGVPMPVIKKTKIQLGTGESGIIYAARQGKTIVAAKTTSGLENGIIEIAFMRTFKHPNMQAIRSFTFDTINPTIYMTVQKNSLADLIYDNSRRLDRNVYIERVWRRKNTDPLPFEVMPLIIRRNYAHQLLTGLVYIHENGIIHRDIKPENILISSSGVLKITDFTLSSAFALGKNDLKDRSGNVYTPIYRPPNILEAGIQSLVSYSTGADIWASGILLLEMETGVHPFGTYSWPELIEIIIHQFINNKIYAPNVKDPNFLNMCVQMTAINEDMRITAKQALAS